MKTIMKKQFQLSIVALSMSLAFAGGTSAQAVSTKLVGTHASTQVSTQVEEAPLRSHLALLASDLFEGRGTGQRGGDLTVAYLTSQVQALGLQPAANGKFTQAVNIAGVKALPEKSSLKLEVAGQAMNIAFGDDWVWAPGNGLATQEFNHDLVFVGYGITAPEEKWDDYKNVDVKNKILIMMVNDPQATAEQPNRFGGKALTYYGRWTYKYEEAMRRGAAGVLLIHTDASASYGWSVVKNGGVVEKFQLMGKKGGNPIQGWITNEVAQKMFAASGLNLDQLRAQAEKSDFRPVTINAKLNGNAQAEVRQLQQFNVAAVVPGTDPKLKDEVVIYTAHWDHLGKQGDTGDTIYNGAVDNASGTAALLAMAKVVKQNPSKRSQMFLWVCAEEQGLLGSAWYTQDPLWSLDKTAASLNLDSLNFAGATRDISTPGSDRTDLAEIAADVAQKMNLKIAPKVPDLSGGFFRSDHFNFAKAGVPAFSILGGKDYIKEPEAAAEKMKAYGKRYHQVSDEYDASWDLAGMLQQAQFTLNLGYAVANAKDMPKWKKGEAFGAARAQKAK